MTNFPATPGTRLGSRLEVLLVVTMAASLTLPGLKALAGFLLLGGLWWWSRPPRPHRRVLLPFLIPVAMLLVTEATTTGGRDPARLQRQIAESYRRTWSELGVAARRALAHLGETSLSTNSELLRSFEVLGGEAARAGSPAGITFLLLDGDGNVVAWAGKGLLHDLSPSSFPVQGRVHSASFSAVTLVEVHPFDETVGGWRLAAGRSLRTDRFPFARLTGTPPRWTLVPPGAEIGAELLHVEIDSGPGLVVERTRSRSVPIGSGTASGWRRLAFLFLGLGLVCLGWQRVGRYRRESPKQVGSFWSLLEVAMGLALLTWAAESPPWASVLLVTAGSVFLLAGMRGGRRLGSRGAAAWGLAVALSAPGASFLIQRHLGVVDLGGELWATWSDLTCRLSLFGLIWALFALVSAVKDSGDGSRRLSSAWALPVLLASAASLEYPLASLFLLATAGAVSAGWSRSRWAATRRAELVSLALVSALTAAIGWELVYRESLRRETALERLASLAPPAAEELEEMGAAVDDFFAGGELAELAPGGVVGLERQDLAFEIWHHSPLAETGGLSALRVIPRDGPLSSFSFGLPVDEVGRVDWSPAAWQYSQVPVWRDAVLAGSGELLLHGQPWARIEYWLALRPGYGLPMNREGDLAAGLLRAGPYTSEHFKRSLEGADYGLYDHRGEALVVPDSGPPRLPSELLEGGHGVLVTSVGRVEVFTASDVDGVRALFLPRLTAVGALERVGTHAMTALLAVGLLFLGSQLPSVARQGIRVSWHGLWHSYSRRLVLVYSILLLVPLGLMNVVGMRALEQRLRAEKEVAGRSALESAQRVLGDYVLALEPGFGIDAALNDELLAWLSGVVHHDVNLYWRSSVYASSKAELFTAGLLPRRIPGEIYARLTLLGHRVASRINQAGGAEYLELYAPLTVPGVSFEEMRLFLSLPLLAQQEETEAQIASLRRRALLGTVSLMLLLGALGMHLARRFTAPLTAIVRGTQRIAAGESSLALRPTELELARLVEAIDDMAGKIADGRRRLLREKSVVERMVENITSGVVSLDEQRRVLMANRVAVQLVGVEVGEALDQAVGRQDRLAPVRNFLRRAGNLGLTQETVQLQDEQGHRQEWSLVWVPLPGTGEPSSLLVLEDVTEVLRSQRLEAWAEMARMIAHEIKNPLTPIRLSTEHMREVYDRTPENFAAVFESCTANILRQVGELQEIASEFSSYSRIPKIEPKKGDLARVVEGVVEGYRTAPPRGIRIGFRAPSTALTTSFDAKLIGRAVRNLIENALRVTPDDGLVEVRVESAGGMMHIVVDDNGPGVRPSLLSKIFDPYFSTHDSGTGLGLPIARRIAEQHGGEVVARNRPHGGLEVVISLPAAPA